MYGWHRHEIDVPPDVETEIYISQDLHLCHMSKTVHTVIVCQPGSFSSENHVQNIVFHTSFFTFDKMTSNCWVSRSRKDLFFEIPYFQEFCFTRPRIFFKNRPKIIFKKIEGLRPAPPPYGAAPLPPTKVGAKCLSVVVLHNQDRALSLLGVGGYF